MKFTTFLSFLSCALGSTVLHAASETSDDVVDLEKLIVYGRAESLVGDTLTASQGLVGASELDMRPFLRRGELLEVIPGLVVTQHSGGGKANQYFLRGFNLDHGTDFSVSADGVPVNMRTHGHGQGYADVNFVIPELVESIAFNKGPFFADVGDFSAAGASDIRFRTNLPHDFVTATAGENNYYRGVAGTSIATGEGTLTVAAELSAYDGPFELPENFQRLNAFGRYHIATETQALTFTILGYDAEWDSTDQIPLRAVLDGRLSRLGTVDPTDGGDSSRYGLTFHGTWRQVEAETRAAFYATQYEMNLFSNFGYLLDDPVNGDQFEQVDDRWVIGGSLEHAWFPSDRGHTTIGLQWRGDLIDEVGLHRSVGRTRLATIRSDTVDEHSIAAFVSHEIRFSDSLRLNAGLRGDYFTFDVDSDLPANSGSDSDFIASPKLNLVYTAREGVEWYLSAGTGFHSNDARGVTIAIDPATGDPADPVDPLVRSKSVEAGLRLGAINNLVSTISVFALELDSELLFVGDAGGTEASGATRRFGVEFANFFQPQPWLAFDADVALTHARFLDAGTEDRVPGAVDSVISAGVAAGYAEGWFGSLRARYFGPRVLVEDGSVKGQSSLLFNLQLGYRMEGWGFAVEVLNLFDREDNDIEYFYESRLPGEPGEGVADIHFHPVEPRTGRVSVTRRF